jgi:hypothetical protein
VRSSASDKLVVVSKFLRRSKQTFGQFLVSRLCDPDQTRLVSYSLSDADRSDSRPALSAIPLKIEVLVVRLRS